MVRNVEHYESLSKDYRGNGRGQPRVAVDIAAFGCSGAMPWLVPWKSAEFGGGCGVAVAIAAEFSMIVSSEPAVAFAADLCISPC